MNSEPDFYIGWQDKAPAAYAKIVRRFVWSLAVLVPLLAGGLVWQQGGFSEGIFEYGQLTKLEGELIREPIPFLRVPVRHPAPGAPLFERVLLIGQGKHGADSTIRQWERRYGSLTGRTLTVRGTLIYHEGHAALELTEAVDALRRVPDPTTASHESVAPPVAGQPFGRVVLRGEITDPKCFLGVMKPGDGRPHRSCAVRCIAGGIPPVLWVKNGEGLHNGYLLVGPSGQPINSQLLTRVGQGVQVRGRLEQADNWLILYVDQPISSAQLRPDGADATGPIALCR